MRDFRFLARVKIFADCNQKELAQIALYLKEKKVKEGESLFHQGDAGNELYVVKRGCVESLIQTVDGLEKVLATFCRGDFFGEMSIIDNAPRSATCRAREDSLLYAMSQASFFKLMIARPRIAIKIMGRMLNITSQRLAATSRFVSDMVRWGNEAAQRAITDEVTGAFNRRYLEKVLAEYFRKLEPHKTCSLIMMDLDHFREINEKYGIAMGNILLNQVVGIMKKNFSHQDIIARYGGDEFTIFMPQTGLEDALKRAEAVRQAVASQAFRLEGIAEPLFVTISQGLASFPQTCQSLEEMRSLADSALYKAKEGGRNRVVYLNSSN